MLVNAFDRRKGLQHALRGTQDAVAQVLVLAGDVLGRGRLRMGKN